MRFTDRLSLMRATRPYLTDVSLRQKWSLFHAFRTEGLTRHQDKIWIHSYLPPIPSPAFDRFRQIAYSRQRIPYQVYLAVSANCPYHCSYCSYGHRPRKQLSTQQFLDIITQLKTIGTAILGLTGGEPLLQPDLPTLIKAASPEMSTILFTTGYNLDTTMAQTLRNNGLDAVAIGLESTDPKTVDKIHGVSGSYEKSITALRACRKAGIYTTIGTIATRQKIVSGELEKIYDLACRHHVHEIRVLSPVATGSAAGNQDFFLRDEDIERVRQFHIQKNRKRKSPVIASSAIIESPLMFGCTAGYHHCYIDAIGNVCPCDLTPLSFGNLSQEPFKDIWEKMSHRFPHPRSQCLMNTIAALITTDTLPLPPEESNCLIPDDKESALPYLFRHILK